MEPPFHATGIWPPSGRQTDCSISGRKSLDTHNFLNPGPVFGADFRACPAAGGDNRLRWSCTAAFPFPGSSGRSSQGRRH